MFNNDVTPIFYEANTFRFSHKILYSQSLVDNAAAGPFVLNDAAKAAMLTRCKKIELSFHIVVYPFHNHYPRPIKDCTVERFEEAIAELKQGLAGRKQAVCSRLYVLPLISDMDHVEHMRALTTLNMTEPQTVSVPRVPNLVPNSRQMEENIRNMFCKV